MRPTLPPSYGAVTIRELVDADDPVRYGEVLAACNWIAASLARK